MAFPETRMRRLRRTAALRDLVRETELRAGQLVLPLFVASACRRTPASRSRRCRGSRGCRCRPPSQEAGDCAALGVAAVLLFGIPADKDDEGSGAWDDEGVVQLATRAIKRRIPSSLVITDVCLCEYTSHGHCGVVREDGTRRQRRLARAARPHRGQPRPRRRRHRRARAT